MLEYFFYVDKHMLLNHNFPTFFRIQFLPQNRNLKTFIPLKKIHAVYLAKTPRNMITYLFEKARDVSTHA